MALTYKRTLLNNCLLIQYGASYYPSIIQYCLVLGMCYLGSSDYVKNSWPYMDRRSQKRLGTLEQASVERDCIIQNNDYAGAREEHT